MQNKTMLVLLGISVFLICLYSLSFNFISWRIQEKAENFATTNGLVDLGKKHRYLDSIWNEPVYNFLGQELTYQEVKQRQLNLGLDLQGGMFLVLEVSPYHIVQSLANNGSDALIQTALDEAAKLQKRSTKTPLELFYSSLKAKDPNVNLAELFVNSNSQEYISMESTNEEVLSYLSQQLDDAINQSFIVLRNRIDKFGVSSPVIQRLPGTNRIQVELAGVDNPSRVRKLLKDVAKLEFVEVASFEEVVPMIQSLNELYVSKKPLVDSTITTSTSLEENDLMAALENDSASTGSENSNLLGLLQSNYRLVYHVKDTSKINDILNDQKISSFIPKHYKFTWQAIPEETENGDQLLELYVLKTDRNRQPLLTGEVVTDARQEYDQDKVSVSMQMNTEGTQKWRKITRESLGKQIAIVLDNYVYSAPVVQSEIPNGSSSITGNFDVEEAKDLANILKSGKMPSKVNIVEESVIGPSLGFESINQGLMSIGLGLGLIILFMIAYYGMGGVVANLALSVNIFFIIGTLTQFGAALTLPGIAGLLLTLGMAVDANVLIYERIKEEIKNGKSIKQSVQEGFKKAYSSILDSNVTTFLTGLILYLFGNGGVKGFALILMIGIASSLFTAVFISRIIFEWLIKKNWINVNSFKGVLSTDVFSKINFDFVGYRKAAYSISSIIIVIGLLIIVFGKGLNFGVDFKGGRSYVVQFDQSLNASEIKSQLSDDFKSSGLEVKTFGSDSKFKITTSYMIEDESSEADQAVEKTLLAGLKDYEEANPTIVSSAKVGATIADDIRDTATTTIIYSLLAIFLYILVRFRKWQFGAGAVIALIHDVLMVFSWYGIAHVLGLNLEVDQVFIAAILTIIGYSINDTVVVFDRIREFNKDGEESLAKVLNKSINNTLSRTLITSMTVLIVVVILLIFGGESLRGFSYALTIGVVFGTFSSIFIASPIVLDFGRRKQKLEKTLKGNRPKKIAA